MKYINTQTGPLKIIRRIACIAVGFLVVMSVSCPLRAQDIEPDIPLEEVVDESPHGEITLSVVDSIGQRNPQDNDHYLFGGMTKSGFHVSPAGTLWVLDRQLDNLRRYTSDGEYIDGHLFPRGRGPGEMQDPTALVVDDRSGTIYVGDTDGRRTTVFDSSMSVQETFTINRGYFDLYPRSEGEGVLVVPWRRNVRVDSPAVRIYRRDGTRIGSFAYVNYHHEEHMERKLKGGAFATYLTQTDEYYFLSISYPYEILVFEKESHDLVRRFTCEMDIYDEIFDAGDERVTMMVPGGHSAGLVAVNDSLILHFINDRIHDQTIIHAFDERGRPRGTINWSSISSTALPPYVATAAAPGNTLYLMAREPYTRIFKVTVRSYQ